MISLRKWAAVALATVAVAGTPAPPAMAQTTTLRMVSHADIKILDPVWTTALITRNHGYMIYDVLFAKDANLKIQPQMAEKYEVSADQLTWTITLRDGLEWHDGTPVTSEDCVASDQALGRARYLWPASVEGDRRTQGGRCQDLRHRAEGAVRPRPRCTRQGLVQRPLHDAQAGR
jgi:ABC-type oligopeptide transport system substrate-binding subunit